MTGVDGTCEYVLDPDDPETWDGEEGDECYVEEDVLNEDGVWTCPHDAEAGCNLCIFHLSISEKDDREVVSAFLNVIETITEIEDGDERESLCQFIGAQFGMLDIRKIEIDGNIDNSINFKHTRFSDGIDCRRTIFGSSLRFDGTTICGDAIFSHTNIAGGAYFENTIIEGNISFSFADVNRLWLKHATIEGRATFTNVRIRNGGAFRAIVVDGNVNLRGSYLGEEFSFVHSNFDSDMFFTNMNVENFKFIKNDVKGSIDFKHVKIDDKLRFDGTTIYGSINFEGAYIEEKSNFNDSIIKNGASFLGATLGDRPNFSNVTIKKVADFKGVGLEQSAFRDAVIPNANFWKANLTDADFTNADFNEAMFEQAKLSRANFFGTDLRQAGFYGAIMGNVQISDSTKFGDLNEYQESFNTIRHMTDEEYEELYEGLEDDLPERELEFINEQLPNKLVDTKRMVLSKAAGQYRILEKLARENAFPDMVSHNFVRRQDIHREQHRQEGRWGRWLRATASKYVLQYGENPWRLIATGLITVVGFGLLYPLVGGLQPTGGSTITLSRTIDNPILLLQSIYYSTLTFTTLGMGDFLPVGLGRVLTTLETSLGAIIIALLVFVFGRRATR